MTLPAKEIQLRGDSILQLPFLPPASLYGARLGDLNDVNVTADVDGNVLTVQPDGSFALEELPAGLGAPEWGDIIGTLTLQTDLAAALAGKAATSHTHASTSEVTGLDAALAAKAPLASPTFTGTPAVPTATGGTNTTQAASTAFVMSAVSAAVVGLLDFKNDQDCSANPNYPAGLKGDVYLVTVAGRIGGGSGKVADVGDAIVCKADNAGGTEASVGASWFILEKNLAGALLSANNLSDIGNAVTARANLGLTIGTHVQAFDADLTALAGLTSAADKGIQFTGAGTAGTFDLTAAAKTILDDASTDAIITTLGGVAFTGSGGLVRRVNPTLTGGLTVQDGTYFQEGYGAPAQSRVRRAQGTVGAPTQAGAGLQLGIFGAQGYTNVSTWGAYCCYVAFVTAEAQTATNNGGYLEFFTCPTGSATVVSRGRIGANGWWGIGVTAEPTAPLDIVGDTVRLRTTKTPATETTTANAGEICWDSNNVYLSTGGSFWRRIPLTGFNASGGSGTLETITITDAAVAMTANRRYHGSIAAFTADRNYTLPAGTAGDVIEVQLTTGDDAFELILLGATGVSINGGTAATEWSRLFINNEFVRFRCFATNDWRIEFDGRIAQSVNGYLATDLAGRYTNAAYSRIPFDTLRQDNANIANATTNNWTVTPRRTGTYAVHLRASHGGSPTVNGIRANINGIATVIALSDGTGGAPLSGNGMFQISANHVVFGELYRDGGISTAEGLQSGDERNAVFFRELL